MPKGGQKQWDKELAGAVRFFWRSRAAAALKQAASGKQDQGARAAVTGGKNMDGFVKLISGIVRKNGPKGVEIHTKRTVLTLPGYFRATKIWDVIVMHEGELVAAIELKSHVGSFGNNFNNRMEEAVGTAKDVWTAYREKAFGTQPQPFVGWVILVEDDPKSRRPVKVEEPHFDVFPEFKGKSYLQRYDLLCQRLVSEQLYTATALMASKASAKRTGSFESISWASEMDRFLASLSGHLTGLKLRSAL